ncbi:unnamed protein product [Periconia digitata]|uniref:AB hydrolase-1 domain-containing protein n=1 Tax=Periconia digitata TaxID=1303443 RepID=A0A9W4UHE0_9PLEO|nr:unnamed protein product [Periconia digitata]
MFTVKKHIITCQSIRGGAHATTTAAQPASLKLAVKEYIPKTDRVRDANTTRVTIIAAHANGIPKEAYEPLWEELGWRLGDSLGGIWIADCAHQGESGVLNEGLVGHDPNWFDHSRDLLALVHAFQDPIQPPIVGVAHSMGCAQLVQLSTMHPRLFQSLILIEPVIRETIPAGPNAALMATNRPDLWSSLSAAKSDFQRSKFYRSWDKRVLDKYTEYGLRRTPTLLYPDAADGSVTLATTKHQEAWSYVRPLFAARPADGRIDEQERLIAGDMPTEQAQYQFHRAESIIASESLPSLYPYTTWIFGSKSYINSRADREDLVARTGRSVRGSAGVNSLVVDGAGHGLPLEKVSETAGLMSGQIEMCLIKYREEVGFWKTYDSGKSARGGLVVSETWEKAVRERSDVKRPLAPAPKL